MLGTMDADSNTDSTDSTNGEENTWTVVCLGKELKLVMGMLELRE